MSAEFRRGENERRRRAEPFAEAASGESGQSLTLVLVIVVIFSLLGAALLSLTSTTALIQQRLEALERGRTAADQAVEFGIDQIIEGAAAADFATSAALLVPGTIDGQTASLTITNVSITSLVPRCQIGAGAVQSPCPSSLSVATGDEVFFSVTSQPVAGSLRDTAQSGAVTVPFAPRWTLAGPSGGATLTPAGRFVAGAPGCYAVEARVNNVVARVAVAASVTCP